MRGRTISIYLPDGNPRSVKISDIQDSIVKAIFIPRNKFNENINLSDIQENIQNPGVYFLFGEENDIGKPTVYIGEAENILTRLKQHNKNKEFWNTAICFISEKKNINKAHIKFLEYCAYNKAKEINKCELDNTSLPTESSLTPSERDFALSFFDDLKVIIATLGYPIFEGIKKEKKNLLICKGKDAYAEGDYTEDGFVIYKGSILNLEIPTTPDRTKKLRQNLLDKKILIKQNNVYILTEDYIFKSPSSAAEVVLGRSANGWTEWKDNTGTSLDEKIRK